ncbi:MAG TPA: hypothetical protein VHA52_06165, partial [Candidatus Babeliaceae bacterium]|nr:hypothetical protein [Candidatus Babeliaceae bacterium]
EILYLIRIVMNSVMAYFSPERRLVCRLNIVGSVYSLWKIHQVKWLAFTRIFKGEISPPPNFAPTRCNPKEIIFKYHFPLFPNSDSKSKCQTCQDDAPPFSLCFPHAPFDTECLVHYLRTATKGLKKAERSFKYYENQYGTITHYNANIQLSQSDLPKCEECLTSFDNHFLEAQYVDWDKSKGHFNTRINISPDPDRSPSRPLISRYVMGPSGCYLERFPSRARCHATAASRAC